MGKLFWFILCTLFRPALGSFLVTVTSTILQPARRNLDGSKTVEALLSLAGTYVTNGVPITAAMFGLTSFKVNRAGTGFIDPKVTQFNSSTAAQTMLASIAALFLRLMYPSGGAATAPSTPAAPVGITSPGAVAVTSDADDAHVIFTPGIAKELPNGGDVSNFSVVVVAEGY